MPIEPPWPIEVLKLLSSVTEALQRAQRAEPENRAIGAVAADVDAAVAKLEALVRSKA